MDLNIAKLKSVYQHPLQQKDSLNINDASHILPIDINRNSVKHKNNSSIDTNSKINHRQLHRQLHS